MRLTAQISWLSLVTLLVVATLPFRAIRARSAGWSAIDGSRRATRRTRSAAERQRYIGGPRRRTNRQRLATSLSNE